MKIILSRTDNIGDVMLTLPMAGLIKEKYPDAEILFIGKPYTKPIINLCAHIDAYINREDLISNKMNLSTFKANVIIFVFPDKDVAKRASKAKIPVRIGTSHRLYHWLYCNKLINLGRRNSMLHEAELNIQLLKPINVFFKGDKQSLIKYYGFGDNIIRKGKGNAESPTLIIHPKSKGSAREWPLNYYYDLIKSLPPNYTIYVTGTQQEGENIIQELPELFNDARVINKTGSLSLDAFIAFIAQADAFLSCSTGPLHIAAALGLISIGIYPPLRPLDAGRWGALGKHVKIFQLDKNCSDCKVSKHCNCIDQIAPIDVASYLIKSLATG